MEKVIYLIYLSTYTDKYLLLSILISWYQWVIKGNLSPGQKFILFVFRQGECERRGFIHGNNL